MKKIIILSSGHPSRNPRVYKEAEALSAAGHEVEVLGLSAEISVAEEAGKYTQRKTWELIGLPKTTSAMPKIVSKIRSYLGRGLHRLTGRENPWQLGRMAEIILNEARKRKADLYLGHLEEGMWAVEQLRKEGKSVGLDMEDWYSEDLLPDARQDRPIRLLKKLEKNLLCKSAYSSCTSEVMADALVKEYGCRKPAVIRNVFPLKDRESLDGKWQDRPGMAKWMERNDPTAKRPKEAPVSIHWFSQTIGPGRGLEMLFQALNGMEGNWELHLRGNLKGYEGWLESVNPEGVRKKLIVHGLVENKELLSRIAEHDIGFCGELKIPANKNLTVSNKLYHYLLAGLAVVASDTEGQKEAAKAADGAVLLFPVNQVKELKARLECLLRNPKRLQSQREQSWAAGGHLCWETESQKLLSGVFSS